MRRTLMVMLAAGLLTVLSIPLVSHAAPRSAPTNRVELGGCAEALTLRDTSVRALTEAQGRLPASSRTAEIARRVSSATRALDDEVSRCADADASRGAVFDLVALRTALDGIVARAVADIDALARRGVDPRQPPVATTPPVTLTPGPTKRGGTNAERESADSDSGDHDESDDDSDDSEESDDDESEGDD